MKLLANVFLLAFVFFLSAPTLVCLLDKEEDVACLYSFAEEEVENEVPSEEGKLKHEALLFDFNYFFENIKTPFISKQLFVLQYENLAHQIFSPPPNNLKYLS